MWAKIFLLIFVFSFLFRTDHSFDQDLGRHLKIGEITLKTHQVPKTNLFSYTNPDFPFINTHWMFEVWAYVVSGFPGGIQGLLIRKIIIILFSVFLILKIIPKEKSVLLLPIGFIFLHVLRERLELRPEIFSFLFTALTLWILERFSRQRTKWIFLLPIIQLMWINTHIYFFIGLMLQVTYIIYIGYQHLQHLRSQATPGRLKLLSIIFILSVIISFLNPNGLSGILYPLNVTKNYGYTIVENQTMFLLESINFKDPNFLFVKLSVGLVALSLLVAFLRKQFEIKNILLSLSGVALALLNVRSFPYLVFLSLPATLQNFGAVSWNALTKILVMIFTLLLLLESLFYLNGDYYKFRADQHEVGLKFVETGKETLGFVLSHNLPSPIYNNFDIGSYILYRGYPKYQVFVDGRPEAYPASFFTDIYIPTQYDYNKFKDLNPKYDFKTIIFSHTDQTPWGKAFLQNVVKDPEWKLVYIDGFMVVLVKQDVVDEKKLIPIDLSKLSPDSYNFTNYLSYLRMGLFLLSVGQQDSGKQFILKAKEIFPQSPIINQIMGNPTPNYFFW